MEVSKTRGYILRGASLAQEWELRWHPLILIAMVPCRAHSGNRDLLGGLRQMSNIKPHHPGPSRLLLFPSQSWENTGPCRGLSVWWRGGWTSPHSLLPSRKQGWQPLLGLWHGTPRSPPGSQVSLHPLLTQDRAWSRTDMETVKPGNDTVGEEGAQGPAPKP